MGTASAATNGVGTTQASSSLIDVSLGNAGSLLHLRVLGDDGKSTVDPAVGPLSAQSSLSALNITSSVLPILKNISLPTPPWQALATGSKTSDSVTPGLDLGNALGGVVSQNASALNIPVVSGLVSSLLNGVLSPGSMTASITDGVSNAGMNLSLANLNILGGLLTTHAVGDTLGAKAAGVASDGNRGLSVDAISVLNLGALLKGLGIDPANLVVGQVTGLLDSLKVPVAGSGVPAGGLSNLVTGLLTTAGQLTNTTGTFGSLGSTVQSTVNGALTPLGGVPAIGGLLTGSGSATSVVPSLDVTNVLGTVNNLLKTVLPNALDALNGVSLLQLNGLQLGAVTHAVNGTSGSTADVISKIGGVSVGGINLGGLDLSSTLSTVTGLINSVSDTINNALAGLNLDGLVGFKLFDKYSNNGVSTSNGYTRALAGITGLHVTVNPLSGLLGIVNGLNAPGTSNLTSIGETITGLGGSIPVVGGLMGTINSIIPNTSGLLGALAGGADIKVADISSGSNFIAPSANPSNPASVSQLPRTGANTMVYMVIGAFMVGGVLAGRRFRVVRQHSSK